MSEVSVDREKLAYGLERGIGNSKTIFREVPKKYRLRVAPCGLVSTAISEYLRDMHVQHELIISRLFLSHEPDMQHVFPVIGDIYEDDPAAIDASYSQFLGHVGLHWGYETYSGTREFPREKIMIFKMSERNTAIDWLTAAAIRFQQANIHPKNEFDIDMGAGPLESADEETISSNYAKIWSPAAAYLWRPPKRVIEDGRTVAKHIPKNAITVT